MIRDGEGKKLGPLPEHLPPRLDPEYGDKPGPYANSGLASAVGTLSNPAADEARRREHYQQSGSPLSAVCPEAELLVGPPIQGFDARAKLTQPPAADWPLTGIITRIGLAAGGQVDLAPFVGTYIIDYAKLSPDAKGMPRHEWASGIKAQLPEGSRLLLSLFDYQIQTGGGVGSLWNITDFWTNSELRPILDQFDGIIVPNMIAFSDRPYPDMLVGERMDQIIINDGYNQRQTIIPCIAWGDPEHSLRRITELWVSQPGVNTICLDCHGPGLDRTLWTWRWLIAIERYCAPQRHIRWIISGITSGWAIQELNRILPDGNYHLIMPLSSYVHAKGATSVPALQQEHLRRAVQRLERLRTGEDKAVAKPRPARWPTFLDCKPRTL